MRPFETIGDTALRFAKALVAGDYAAAHSLLTQSLQEEESAATLKASYDLMVSYTEAPPDTVKVGQYLSSGENDGVPEGLGWVCVDIDCLHSDIDAWLEGVTVLVVCDGPRHAIGRVRR